MSGYFLSLQSKFYSDQFLLFLTVSVVVTVYRVHLTRGSYWRGAVVSPRCLQDRCEKVGSESLSNLIGVGSVSVGVSSDTLTVVGRSPVLEGSQHSHPVQSWRGSLTWYQVYSLSQFSLSSLGNSIPATHGIVLEYPEQDTVPLSAFCDHSTQKQQVEVSSPSKSS